MVERAVDRAEEGRTVARSLGVGELRAQRVQPLVHPAVVTCHHLAVFGTDHGNDCSRSSRLKKRGAGAPREPLRRNVERRLLYSTRSPWRLTSRPSRSSSSETRRPIVQSMTFRMMKLPTPLTTSVVATAPI